MFFDPLVSLVQHTSQIGLAFLQLLLQSHSHVLFNITQPGLVQNRGNFKLKIIIILQGCSA